MIPLLVVRVRRAVRRVKQQSGLEAELSGAETEARWEAMLSETRARDREVERRLAEAEDALNRLRLN